MNNLFETTFQSLHEINYKGIPLKIELYFKATLLKISIKGNSDLSSPKFEIEFSRNEIPYEKAPLLFLSYLIKQSIENHSKADATASLLAEKTTLKLYKISEVEMFDIFPKHSKEEFEKLKLQNSEKSASNLLDGKAVLLRIKIENFKPGKNFDFRLQVPKILPKQDRKEFSKALLEEQIMRRWESLVSKEREPKSEIKDQ